MKFIITGSFLQDFRICPRKAFYTYIDRLENIYNPPFTGAMDLGLEVHAVLEARSTKQPDPQVSERALELATQTIENCSFWDKITHNELKLQAPLTNEVMFEGSLDGIFEDKGKAHGFDWKTTSSIPTFLSKTVDTRPQYSGYLWLAKQNSLKLSDVFYVCGISTKKEFEYTEFPVMRDEARLRDWHEHAVYAAHELVRFIKENRFPKTRANDCVFYFKPCPYAEICNAPDQEKAIISTLYQQKEATPQDKFRRNDERTEEKNSDTKGKP